MVYFLLVLSGILLISTGMDLSITIRGLKAGAALEGNPIIYRIWGGRPSVTVLYGFWIFVDVLLLAALFLLHLPVLLGLSIGAVIGSSVAHVYGWSAWQKLLDK